MSANSHDSLIRFLCLLWPSLILILLVLWRRPNSRQAGAALLASLWNLSSLLFLQLFAARFEWWKFEAQHATLLGIPGELLLGWALFWGAIPLLTGLPLWKCVPVAIGLDLLVMPACAPVVQLGRFWLAGEAAAIFLALVPGLILGHLVQSRTQLKTRIALLIIAYVGFTGFALPSLILEQTGGSWSFALGRSQPVNGIFFQIVFLVAIPGLSAVQAFDEQGEGTPLPFDPPRRMVTSGPYAYIANPMQTSTTLILLLLGWWTASLWVAGAAGIAMISTFGIAGWHEHTQLSDRFGFAWLSYREEVRNWWPRWRPRVFVPSTLYFAQSCGPCSELARWLQARNPTGLLFAPAELHPTRNLRRLTYEAPGWSASGILALARALEHLHLGWAWIGWILRIPPIASLVQWLADHSGAGERKL